MKDLPKHGDHPGSDLEARDISDEKWREYYYPEFDYTYRIEKPRALYTRPGGSGHRVVDKNGVTHWVPIKTFHFLRWEANPPVSF